METESNTVLDISLHALKDLTSRLDSQYDRAKTRGKEDNVSGGLSGFRGALDGNTTIGFLERRSIVDTCVWILVRCRNGKFKLLTVSSHGSQVTSLLQHFYDLVLVLGKDFGESIGAFN